ncbi:MAG: type II toxin-antitoxin system VapC family toxin [Acidobacteriota bacterium]|nr:type II toxin-antitoxin system VapC family toxin [Acidobacteriota bacterium]
MKTALDTNILSSILSNEPGAEQLAWVLGDALAKGALVVCGPVYSELLAYPGATPRKIASFLKQGDIAIEYPADPEIWRLAGMKYAGYALRRRKTKEGAPKRLLADFVIAAHASLHADRLLTLDKGRYRRDFPDLRLQ